MAKERFTIIDLSNLVLHIQVQVMFSQWYTWPEQIFRC